jgi:hypothetical protein
LELARAIEVETQSDRLLESLERPNYLVTLTIGFPLQQDQLDSANSLQSHLRNRRQSLDTAW